MKSRVIIVVILLVMVTMACSFTKNAGGSPTDQVQPGAVGSTPDPDPVPLNDGLASLNSYEMTVTFSSFGPDPSESSTTTILRLRSNETNMSTTSISMVSNSPEAGSSTSETIIYQIGTEQCSGSDLEGWSFTSTPPAEAELQGLVSNMIGLTPLIDDPVFVSTETLLGIPTNHFSFKVSGLGATSGAVVNLNQGDYWLAVDGQYIVKYILIIETSTAAEGEVFHEEISIELNQVNQPVSIAFPQACLDASLYTP